MTDEDHSDPAVPLPEGGLYTATDPELIALVRAGDAAAYEHLFLRHRDAAARYARRIAGTGRAEDLCAEAFTKILDLLQRGKGPEVAFRAYLLTTVRTCHLNWLRTGHREELVPDHEPVITMRPVNEDPDDRFDRAAIYRAFKELPERWQAALWLTAVEGLSNESAGERLGVSPNAIASLAFRARSGLRQAYLAEHLLETTDPQCRQVLELLPSHLRATLAATRRPQVDKHLSTCASCTTAALELSAVDTTLGALLAPLALSGFAATGALVPAGTAHAGGVVSTLKGTVSAAVGQVNGWFAGSSAVLGTKVAVAATVAAVGVTVGAHAWREETQLHADRTATAQVTDQAAPGPRVRKSAPQTSPTQQVSVDAPGGSPSATGESSVAGSPSDDPSANATPRTGPAARTMAVGKMQSQTYEQDGARWNRVTVPVDHPADNATLHLVSTRTREASIVTPLGGNGWSCTTPLLTILDGLLLHVVTTDCTYHGSPADSADLVMDYRVGTASHLGVLLVPPMGYLDLSMIDNIGLLNLLS